jgi:hypothetical protein
MMEPRRAAAIERARQPINMDELLRRLTPTEEQIAASFIPLDAELYLDGRGWRIRRRP